MKWKLTGRYLFSVVLIVTLVIFINVALALTLLVLNIPIFGEKETNPEQFTRQFQKNVMITSNNYVTITEKGQKELNKKNAWIQILDENGQEVFSFRTPSEIKKKYTPLEMIQMYKYKESANTVVYVGEKKGNNRHFSYLIGIENSNLNRYFISYDNRDILPVFKVGMVVFVIDILIALLVGYIFSKRLTRPLHTLIDGIKKLANHEFDYYSKPRGLYKNVFLNLNHLSTQLKANENERKKLDVMKEEWISNISHDMKTPLSSIQGYAEMIKDPDYDFTLDEIREYAEIIETKSLYIKEVIEDLNLTTRLKNKELTLNKKAINIVSLLRNIVIDILNDPKYGDRDIQFHVNEENITLEVDEILFRRAINNLIYNAIVHNDHDVKIVVSIERKERTHIVIKDDGKGIKEEEIERIFDRYYRGTNTGAAHKGSGLGMAIANDIIQAHNGEIIMNSEVGHGTIIVIQI